MKESFDAFYRMLELDQKNSPWSNQNTMQERYNELVSEVHEIGLAMKNNDTENFKEELGDALWDLLFMIILAENEKMLTAKEVIDGAAAKLKRRKPWIFSGEKLTLEEEVKRWHEIKKLEKAAKK